MNTKLRLSALLLLAVACGDGNDDSSAPATTQAQAEALAEEVTGGDVQSAVLEEEEGEGLLYKVEVALGDGTVTVEIDADTGELHVIEAEEAPFTGYDDLTPVDGQISYAEARAAAFVELGEGTIEKWEFTVVAPANKWEFYVRNAKDELWEIYLTGTGAVMSQPEQVESTDED